MIKYIYKIDQSPLLKKSGLFFVGRAVSPMASYKAVTVLGIIRGLGNNSSLEHIVRLFQGEQLDGTLYMALQAKLWNPMN